MDSEPLRDLSIDLFQKLQELDCPVALIAFADDEPRGDIKCRKQRGRTMPHIAVRAPFRHDRHHRQDWLVAIFSSTLRTTARFGLDKEHPPIFPTLQPNRGSLDRLYVLRR